MVEYLPVYCSSTISRSESRKFDNNNSYGEEQDIFKVTLDNVNSYTIYYENGYIINTS